MKSLVALLDRKKKDRANTLVQVPFPSALPHSAVRQDGPNSTHSARRTSTPSSFLRPQQPRATSDSQVYYPFLSKPSPYYQGHPLAQSASYYTDSDDSIFVDPFAPSPTKIGLTPKPYYDMPRQVNPRRGSESNSAGIFTPSSQRFPASQEPRTFLTDESKSHSGVAAPTSKRGRWLRERRSLTSLLRPQQPNNSAESTPAVPPLPNRVLERKSSFFARARSGSTPSTTRTAEPTHTTRQPPTEPGSTQLATAVDPQPQVAEPGFKNGSSYRGATPLTSTSFSQADSPDSWVRVGGVSQDPGMPSSPTTRRRAISVPLPLPYSTKPPPPVPDVQCPRYTQKLEVDHFTVAPPEPTLIHRPVTPAQRRARPTRNAHGMKSASMSVPAPAMLNAGARFAEHERLASKHGKQLSVGGAEGLTLKSALKHRLVGPTPTQPAFPIQPVKPLRICKREGVTSKTNLSALPTLSSESSLSDHPCASVDHTDGARGTIQHQKNANGSSLRWEHPDVGAQGVTTSTTQSSPATTDSPGNFMKGNSLSNSDSRSLPVLDNIWGSFISETAFGSSLPPSPVASINARHRVVQPQETKDREQIRHRSTDFNAHCSGSEPHWTPGSAPPSSPPVANLPPVPKPPPALALSLGKYPRHKRSGSSANPTALLTPPTSPTEEVKFQGLDHVITTSTTGDKIPGRSGSKCLTPRQQLGPRLGRSVSSPSICPPVSPEIGYTSINTRGLGAISRLSVQNHNSRSISPSSASQSSSQCTPVPGTPVSLPYSIGNPTASYLGTSNGSLVTSDPNVRIHREGAESSEAPLIGVCVQVPGTVSRKMSDAIHDQLASASSSPVWPYEEEKTISAVGGRDVIEGDSREELLLTPPVTPAWAAHVFDLDAGDDMQLGRMGHDEASDHIPLARMGNLAQMRRQKRGDMRSGSIQLPMEHLPGPDIVPSGPRKTDMRGDKPSRDAKHRS